MSNYYDMNTRPCSRDEWSDLLSSEDKIIQQTELENGMFVSTVYLGLDHRYGEGPPLIFETMVFPSKNVGADLYCERYTTKDEAEKGHERIIEKTKEGDLR